MVFIVLLVSMEIIQYWKNYIIVHSSVKYNGCFLILFENINRTTHQHFKHTHCVCSWWLPIPYTIGTIELYKKSWKYRVCSRFAATLLTHIASEHIFSKIQNFLLRVITPKLSVKVVIFKSLIFIYNRSIK